MGAGTNFQKHLVALHHVDVAWKPRDIEQREGRILRNGNLNKEVEIFTYEMHKLERRYFDKKKFRLMNNVLKICKLILKVLKILLATTLK